MSPQSLIAQYKTSINVDHLPLSQQKSALINAIAVQQVEN